MKDKKVNPYNIFVFQPVKGVAKQLDAMLSNEGDIYAPDVQHIIRLTPYDMRIWRGPTTSQQICQPMYARLSENLSMVIARSARYDEKENPDFHPLIVVGRDNRENTQELYNGVMDGLTMGGADIRDIGYSISPQVLYLNGLWGAKRSFEITASHYSEEYSGYKISRANGQPLFGDRSLKKTVQLASQGAFDDDQKMNGPGKIIRINNADDIYLEHMRRGYDFLAFPKIRIAIETFGHVVKYMIPKVFQGCNVEHIFVEDLVDDATIKLVVEDKVEPGELHNLFSFVAPDPTIRSNLARLHYSIQIGKCDFGIAFDGDADRIIFMDKYGEVARPDQVFALLIKIVLSKNKKLKKDMKKILFDERVGRIIESTILKYGGQPISCRTGHAFIVRMMQELEILLGIEFTGHVYTKRSYGCEDPFFALYEILEYLGKTGMTFEQAIAEFDDGALHSDEINYSLSSKEDLLNCQKSLYNHWNRNFKKQTKIASIDEEIGSCTLLTDTEKVILRGSHSQGLARLTIESFNGLDNLIKIGQTVHEIINNNHMCNVNPNDQDYDIARIRTKWQKTNLPEFTKYLRYIA